MFEWSPGIPTLDELLPQIEQNETNNKKDIMITMSPWKTIFLVLIETSIKLITIM